MATKNKTQQNDTTQETGTTPLGLATAQQMLQAAERERRERFAAELDLLCREYAFVLTAEPYLDDGRTRARVVVKDANK